MDMMHTSQQRGFTLIELMVSVAIFAVVMVIALGALLSISTADRKAETVGSVMNNLNFAVEGMTRNIRTGVDYHCGSISGGDCAGGGTVFAFTSASGLSTLYKFENIAIDSNAATVCSQPSGTVGCILRSTNGGGTYLPITAPEVVITGLTFYLRGSTRGSPDNTQPNTVITATGYVQTGTTQAGAVQKSQFALQTSVTQRLYDK